jgi:GT2 family glycosyltransferase
MSAPLVSVIVLNMNGESIIGRCLDHLLAQSYPNIEIIVVDNGSSDGSLAILQTYLATGKVTVVRNERNLGVPGGRNQGLLYARGTVVAFIDNDGYAAPDWLEECLRTLGTDPQIGAVAPAVFFNKRKIILNGVGATINRQGYGGDLCFNVPYEFATPPSEALYPMGCGMVIRKDVMDRIGPLDALLVNYYDDTEVGIRIWKLGFRVVAAPEAWVDHDFNYSDRLVRNKLLLCERNRIRTVLKYYPPAHLPSWFLGETYLLRYLRRPGLRGVPFRAWAWNLLHLASALRWRFKFGLKQHGFWKLVEPSWGSFPPPGPNNQEFRPDPAQASERLSFDSTGDAHHLNFGWYYVERDGPHVYRWSDGRASAFFRFTAPVRRMSMTIRHVTARQRSHLILRRAGEIEPVVRFQLEPSTPTWQDTSHPVVLGPGMYEWLLLTEPPYVDGGQRPLGAAVARLEFA